MAAAGPQNVLLTRVIVGAALVALALAAVWTGGMAFLALVALAVLLMFVEWCVMNGVGRRVRLAGLITLAAACALVGVRSPLEVALVLIGAAAVIGLFVRSFDWRAAFWAATGLIYCGLPGVALLWLRSRPDGAVLVMAIFVIVWTTDIAAFFAGRSIGGRKLAPSISPNKTWAGALGGIAGAVVVAELAMLGWQRIAVTPPIGAAVLTAAALSILAIIGDLFESWLKRRAGVKDSGRLLPGHGGVLDRLDGLVPVAVAGSLIAGAFGA